METVRTDTLQAQGWEKWLSRIRFPGRDKLYKINPIAEIVSPIIYQDVPSSTVESGYAFLLVLRNIL